MKRVIVLLALMFSFQSAAGAQEDPGDGGASCALCGLETVGVGSGTVTFQRCFWGYVGTGYHNCTAGGVLEQSSCVQSNPCGGGNDFLLASGRVGSDGLLLRESRVSLMDAVAESERFEKRPIILTLRRACSGFITGWVTVSAAVADASDQP